MSWTDLTLIGSEWATATGYPAARVRPLAGVSNAAELEGYLAYSGISPTVDVAVNNEASLPSGTFDPSGNHTICGRWYNSTGGFLATTEVLITKDGSLAAITVPSGAALLFFGDVYPVS